MAGCGCNGTGYGDAFGRAPVRDRRTRRLQKVQAGTGKAKGVQLAATLAAAMHAALRGQPWKGGARVAAKARAQAAIRPQLAQLRADPNPTNRLTRTVQIAMSALGSSPSETALAVQYVLARSRGQTRATPREYLAAMRGGAPGGTFSASRPSFGPGGSAPRLPLGVRGFPRRGGLPQGPGVVGLLPRAGLPGGAARIDPSARMIPGPAGLARRQGSFAPTTPRIQDRLVGLLPRAAGPSDGDDAPTGTPAVHPLAPRLPGIRALPRLPGAALTPQAQAAENAENADESESSTAGGGVGGALSSALARFRGAFERPGADQDDGGGRGFAPGFSPGFSPGGAGLSPFMQIGGPSRDALIQGGPLRAQQVEIQGDTNLAEDALSGFGDLGEGAWDRWRTKANMQKAIAKLKKEIDYLRDLRDGGGVSADKRDDLNDMIKYRQNRIAAFEKGLRDKKSRQSDRGVWARQQRVRFAGPDLGAAGRFAMVGLSPLDAIKPYALPLVALGLFGFLLSRGSASAAASPRRKSR